MSLKEAIHSVLTDDDAVTAIAGDRIRPGKADANDDLPYVVYRVTSRGQIDTAEGASEWFQPTVEVISYGDTRAAADSLAEAVADILNGYAGTVEGVEIAPAILEDEDEGEDDDADGDYVFYTSHTYRLLCREA
jgi:hypothetical protein